MFSFFLHFFFCRDFFFRVSLCLDYVDEIRNPIVIKSMIIFVFFINFVDETKSITLCLLAKSKRRCLNELIQRQKMSRIFSTIHNFCFAKRATQIFLWARFSWVMNFSNVVAFHSRFNSWNQEKNFTASNMNFEVDLCDAQTEFRRSHTTFQRTSTGEELFLCHRNGFERESFRDYKQPFRWLNERELISVASNYYIWAPQKKKMF